MSRIQNIKEKETEWLLRNQPERVKHLLLNAVGLVLAGSGIYGYNPVGIAFMAALNMYKGTGMISIVMLALGMAQVFYPIEVLKYVAILFATVSVYRILSIGRLYLNEVVAAGICAGITLIMEMSDIVMERQVGRFHKEVALNIMVVVAVSVLTGILCYTFSRVIRALLESKQTYANEEMLGIAVTMGLFVYGLGSAYHVPISGTEILIFFLVMYGAYKYGIGMGALIGTACSIPLCLWSGEMNYIGILCMFGLLIGVCRELGKIMSIAAALIYGAGIYALFPAYMGDNMVKGLLGAVVIFAMLPRTIIFRYEENINTEDDDGIKSIFEERLMNMAKTFDSLSKSFVKEEMDEYGFPISGNSIYFMEENMTKTQEEKEESALKMSDRIWRNKFDESRMLMSRQLEQISKIIEEYSKQVYDFVRISDKEQDYIRNRLKAKKIYLDKIVGIENKRNKKEYLVTAKCEKGATIGSREIAEVISEAMGKTYIPSKNCRKLISSEYTTTTYVEENNFYVLHAMAGRARGENGISGDNYSLRELDNGQLLMGLSDGMGCGTSACLESETVIELLEQLLDSGFDADTSMRMINSVMVMNSHEDHPATLDYGVLDLHSGVCDLIKIGAAATYVKRGKWVETIKSTSMPLGIFSEVDYESTSKKLYDGDMIIMVSDGVIDAFAEKEMETVISANTSENIFGSNVKQNINSMNQGCDRLSKIISEIKSHNPKEIAEIILNSAMEGRTKLSDDMTVLVTGIWKNEKKVA